MGKNNNSEVSISIKKSLKRKKSPNSLLNYFQSIINHAYIGIITIDENGNIETFNPAMEKLFGYQAEEVIGQNVSILMPEPHKSQHDSYIQHYLETGQAKVIGLGREVEALKKDGSIFPIELKINEIILDNRKIFVGYIRDLREQKKAEETIARQNQELLELSTPVIQVWEGILALPLIGTLDSSRTQTIMENLLSKIVDSNSNIAILDISGVPTVDTMVAQHLIKTVQASKLMGAECIISGIRPEIAQTIVQLGIDLSSIKTKSTMAEALKLAFQLLEYKVIQNKKLEQ